MNYIEYMKDGNKTSDPQYIPGFKQIQPFRRYLIKPSELAIVPQGMYRRNFKFNSDEPVSSKGVDARHIEVPTTKPKSNSGDIFNWLNYSADKLPYNLIGLDNTNIVNRLPYLTSAQ